MDSPVDKFKTPKKERIFVTVIEKIQRELGPLKKRLVGLLAFAAIILYLLGVVIYQESKIVIEKNLSLLKQQNIIPRKSLEKSVHRPNYHRHYEKMFRIKGIVMPVYFEEPSSRHPGQIRKKNFLRKIVLDFTVVSSHPYVKSYFWNNHNLYLIRDRINSHLEPIAIDFPLEKEGKSIIREKIKSEINALIRELNIAGEIEEIYIHHILAT